MIDEYAVDTWGTSGVLLPEGDDKSCIIWFKRTVLSVECEAESACEACGACVDGWTGRGVVGVMTDPTDVAELFGWLSEALDKQGFEAGIVKSWREGTLCGLVIDLWCGIEGELESEEGQSDDPVLWLRKEHENAPS